MVHGLVVQRAAQEGGQPVAVGIVNGRLDLKLGPLFLARTARRWQLGEGQLRRHVRHLLGKKEDDDERADNRMRK